MGQDSTFRHLFALGDIAADEDSKVFPVMFPDFPGVITAVSLSADTTTADRDTNYNTFALLNAGTAGTGSTSMATLANGPDSGGVTITTATGGAFTLSTTLANRAFSAGEILKLTVTKSGSGQAVPQAKLFITGRRDN